MGMHKHEVVIENGGMVGDPHLIENNRFISHSRLNMTVSQTNTIAICLLISRYGACSLFMNIKRMQVTRDLLMEYKVHLFMILSKKLAVLAFISFKNCEPHVIQIWSVWWDILLHHLRRLEIPYFG